MSTFEEDLAAQSESELGVVNVPVQINSKLYLVRVEQMHGSDWADLIDHHPPRPDVGIDREMGYNFRALTPEYIAGVFDDKGHAVRKPKGQLLYNGDPVDVTAAQWDSILRSIDGGALSKLGDAIWQLNEANALLAVDAMKKALEGASRDS